MSSAVSLNPFSCIIFMLYFSISKGIHIPSSALEGDATSSIIAVNRIEIFFIFIVF
jgi:hypothetical protein